MEDPFANLFGIRSMIGLVEVALSFSLHGVRNYMDALV